MAKLATDRQRIFYDLIAQRKLPVEPQNLYNNLDVALDFFQSYLAYVDTLAPETGRKWRSRVEYSIRDYTRQLRAGRIREYFTLAVERNGNQEVLAEAILFPFGSGEGEVQWAIESMDLLISAMISEDMLEKPKSGAALFLPVIVADEAFLTWKLFLEGLKNGNSRAQYVFRRLLFVMGVEGLNPKFTAVTDPYFATDDGTDPDKMVREFSLPMTSWETDFHRIPVPEDYVYICNRMRRSQEHKILTPAFISLLTWFESVENQFAEQMQIMWDNLQHPSREPGAVDVKRGLRAGGLDIVGIKISELLEVGFRHCQLVPRAPFPNFIARCWEYIPGVDVRIYRDIAMSPAKEFVKLDPDEPNINAIFGKIQQFIALHSFWKIATKEVTQRARVQLTNKSREYRDYLERKFLVRPHFRWLVPGWNASDHALTRSLGNFGYLPPEGKTFVKSDLTAEEQVRGILPLPPEIRPVYIYTSEDLGY